MTSAWSAAIAAFATVVFVGLDLRDRAFRAGLFTQRRRALRNLAFFLSNIVTLVALNAAVQWLLPYIPPLWSWHHAPPQPVVWTVLETVACVVLAEAVNWISHAVKHVQPWLWTFHLQHHVERHYSTALTLHTHGVDVVVSGVAMAALLAWCGFAPAAVELFTVLYFVANLYKHCSARMSLGPLDALIVSPAYHRLHHAKGFSGNYGSVLTLFDVLFGTAVWPNDAAALWPTRGRRGPATAAIYTLPLGTEGDEPFGFRDEMTAFLRRR